MAITFVGSGSPAQAAAAGTLAVPFHASTAVGDFVVVPIGVNSATLATVPSGWTASGAGTSSGGQLPSERIFGKFVTSGEVAAGQVNVTVAASANAVALTWRGVDTTSPFEDFNSTASSTATTTYSMTNGVTTGQVGSAIIALGTANRPGGTWTISGLTGWTETLESAGVNPSTGVEHLIWSGSGSTGTISMVGSTNVRGCAGMVALRPAVTSTAYPVDGSASATSTTVAAAVLIAAIAGSAIGLSNDSGAASSTQSVVGSAAAASTASGSITSTTRPVSGAASGTSTAAASATSTQAITGTSTGSSTTTGTLVGSTVQPASGTASALTSSTGSVTARTSAAGTAAGSSNALGSALLRASVAGTAVATSGATGDARYPGTHHIAAPERLLTVAAEDRYELVGADLRTATVPADQRRQEA